MHIYHRASVNPPGAPSHRTTVVAIHGAGDRQPLHAALASKVLDRIRAPKRLGTGKLEPMAFILDEEGADFQTRGNCR